MIHTGLVLRRPILAAALIVFAWVGPATALSQSPYLQRRDFDVVHLLPPPPAAGSPAEQNDIETVLRMQSASSPERIKLAEDDATAGLAAFATVLGKDFDISKLPVVAAFFRKVGRDTQFATTIGKDCWERSRPFVSDTRIHPPGAMREQVLSRKGAANTAPHDSASPCPPAKPTPAYSYSYPSGHATFGAMTAILLAQMVPEKRSELYARGWDFGDSRIVGGVHYPSDVEAGRIDAASLVTVMTLNHDFQADLSAAKAELRAALGLSP